MAHVDRPERLIWLVNIDIKDGWYDTIHAFTTMQAAEEYIAWQDSRGGDHCYISVVALDDGWVPPSPEALESVWSL